MIGFIFRSISIQNQRLFSSPSVKNHVKHFHTSSPRNKFPLLILFAKPLSRVAAFLLGRGTRFIWKRLSDNKKRSVKDLVKANKGKFLLSGGVLGGGFYYLYESHIEICPITGRKKFVALTPAQARKIGEDNFKSILSDHHDNIVPEGDPVYAEVSRIANRILHANRDWRQIYDKEWTLTVVDTPETNAFVLPSGNMFVFTGLLKECENSDMVGIVLSHEIAHVVLGHVQEKLTYTSFLEMLLLVPMALLWAVIPSDGIAFITSWFCDKVVDIMLELPYSRFMETEADEVGLTMAAKACLDVREAPAFWAKLSTTSDDPELDNALEFFSTHPANETREDHLMELLPPALEKRRECGCEKFDPMKMDPLKRIQFYNKIKERKEEEREEQDKDKDVGKPRNKE